MQPYQWIKKKSSCNKLFHVQWNFHHTKIASLKLRSSASTSKQIQQQKAIPNKAFILQE